MQLFHETMLLSPQGPHPLNDRGCPQLFVIERGVVQQCADVLGRSQAVSLHYPKEGVVHWFSGLHLRAIRNSAVLLADNDDVERLTNGSAEATRDLRRSAQRQVEIASAWLHNLTNRSAEQLAHFVCEQAVRIGSARLPAISFRLPNQTQIGDALACTPVHINRMLKLMKSARLIKQTGSYIEILDWEGLRQLGRFSDQYLRP